MNMGVSEVLQGILKTTSWKQRMKHHGACSPLHVVTEEPHLLTANPIIITQEYLWTQTSSTKLFRLVDETFHFIIIIIIIS